MNEQHYITPDIRAVIDEEFQTDNPKVQDLLVGFAQRLTTVLIQENQDSRILSSSNSQVNFLQVNLDNASYSEKNVSRNYSRHFNDLDLSYSQNSHTNENSDNNNYENLQSYGAVVF